MTVSEERIGKGTREGRGVREVVEFAKNLV